MDLERYKTIVFDCDGVIFDSNQLKIQAYFETALRFGANKQQAQALVDYHVLLGGISRFIKFEYFLREIVRQPVTDAAMQSLLDDFGHEVERRLLNCEIAPGLMSLRNATPDARWMVISGGDQAELRKLFELRGIDHLFATGIYGSPDNKDEILKREIENGNLQLPALFIGDSRYDHQASTNAGLDFIFMSDWTDFEDWQIYCQKHNIAVAKSLETLLGLFL